MSAYFTLRFKFNHAGVTLVELLVVMTLGMLLISFLLSIYLASQRSYHIQTALGQIQDNAKTAVAILQTDIRKAGYIGCARLSKDFNAIYSSYSITPQTRLTGHTAEITVRYMGTPIVTVKKSKDSSTLVASNESNFSSGDVLMISDCNHVEMFRVKAVSRSNASQTIMTAQPLQNHYDGNAEIGRVEINRYFIARTNRKNPDGSFIYALFLTDVKQHKIELVENIRDMRVLYSILQGNKITEVSSEKIEDWSKVTGVAIELDVTAPPVKVTWHLYVSLKEEAV
ncbi:PilW family protein [Aquicella lusitana]|uniref:Pilin/secretion family protein with methylation motif n=1 Tax=Aquicella lusitana TaxID=254246 RepID=A0A370GZV6_9COXI|nr:prepilin-type N-terminal cleavage/methylation domain-containing protein [Aquicella lusitana]RDI48811.1 pilin/secretion family protein with methylation motif [Aquicella lusitana]VVC73239.1 hypothetical protein AQULUS_09710 [Aquicella lusitana]